MKAAGKRQKGNDGEREVVATLKKRGFSAWRIPMSGAADGFPGDVKMRALGLPYASNDFTLEVKRRKGPKSGFRLIRRWLSQRMFALWVRGDYEKDWLVVMRAEDWMDLMWRDP
jgi:hypothetical protein